MRGDGSIQSWKESIGFGRRRSLVKYFDTSLAFQNTKSAVEPGRIIELTPFKLHVFETVKNITGELRSALQQSKQANAQRLAEALETTRNKFENYEGRLLSKIDERSLNKLPAEITLGESFARQDLLHQKRAEREEMEKASSPDGLKLLKAEQRDLEAFVSSVESIIQNADGLWALHSEIIVSSIAEKQDAQKLLAQTLILPNSTLDGLLELLRVAAKFTDFSGPSTDPCPVCRRPVGESEQTLFRQYHDLLNGELERQISSLKDELKTAADLVKAVYEVDRKTWEKYVVPTSDVITLAENLSKPVVAGCATERAPSPGALHSLTSLKALLVDQKEALNQKSLAVETASKGQETVNQQIEKLAAELEPLEYSQTVSSELDHLKEVQRLGQNAAYYENAIPSFTPLLKKITNTAKAAYEDLVVNDFEARLDAEYQTLAEKSMKDIGVKLARKGSDASVTVLPQIGGQEIVSVLSEGEQRIHALALFFAELETTDHPVLVFDDPISSFDYNYIANYCLRLRDFIAKHSNRQIIVLTHNWEFFVQLQTTLNASGLGNQLSVQLLEGCSVVGEYSEKIDELKSDISAILVASGEPPKSQKEILAGKMRRLVESIVNTHVFNNLRHQYKQKSQSVSEFDRLTKLIPLENQEATKLRDLYAKLSITEHDDPRNSYVNTDKAMFKTRYDAIIAVEAAIVARK
jgi:hypothetical protein